MQKIKYGVLDKLLRADLSRAEMDFILHISHYQDDTIGIFVKHYRYRIRHFMTCCAAYRLRRS